MTMIYRSPNVIVDDFEWYVAVRTYKGHPARYFYFRPLAIRPDNWRRLDEWEGHKPTGRELNKIFHTFRHHIKRAMESDKVRKEALARRALHRAQMEMAA